MEVDVMLLYIVFYELFLVWNVRSEEKGVLKIGFKGNKWLLLSVITLLAISTALPYLSIGSQLGLTPLKANELIITISFSLTAFLLLPEFFTRKKK